MTINFRVAKIDIQGNDYLKESTIKGIMLTKTAGLFHKGNFVPEVFEGDILAIKNSYNNQGFLGAEVDYDLVFDSTKQFVDIQVKITEGRQTLVEDINFTGNVLLGRDLLIKNMTTRKDEPFDRRKIEIDNYIITSMYDDLGYVEANIQSEYTVNEYKATISHSIIEGEKQFIEKVELVGLEKTREDVLMREIKLKPNDKFCFANILKSQRHLYNLGIFKSIRIQTENGSQPNLKIVRFILMEKTPMLVNFRIGYGTRDYLRLGAGFSHFNILGRCWQGTIEGKLSFVEYRLNSQLTFPRLIIIPIKYSFGAFYQFKKEIGYRTRSIGGYNSFQFNLGGGKLSTKYDIAHVRTYYSEYRDSVDNDLIHGLMMSWLRDRRDDPIFPARGNYVNIILESSGIILPSDVDYLRPTFDIRLYRPLSFIITATSFKIGLVQEIAPTTDVPIYKRFYCGGTSSVRGYSERSIGPKDDSGNPVGGKILFEISQEIRFPLYKILGGAVFLDGGNIWQNYDDFEARLRCGIGAGLRLKIPLGSIRLDYGVKIRPEREESPGVLHFAIGEAF